MTGVQTCALPIYGSSGFDDRVDIDELLPLNGYGYSKQIFDLWVKYQAKEFPSQWVGLKFFNVYGPNEYFKGNMASMVFHGYNQIRTFGEIRLFKSYNMDYKDGEQLRDFIYVKDVCEVVLWLLKNPAVSGLFNVGTSCARSFKELAVAIFNTLNIKPNIRYIDMPSHLKEKYQYCTEAKIEKLRIRGYNEKFYTLEEGIKEYVESYLNRRERVF